MKVYMVTSPYEVKRQTETQAYLCSTLSQNVQCVATVEEADVIVPVGGDGTMLHAIRMHREENKPFVGINAGTRGFLLNALRQNEAIDQFLSQDIDFIPLWMLQATVQSDSGEFTLYGFNDIWVERAGGQTLRMFLQIDDKPPSSMIVGDGMLFSSPQGSTGYNLSLRGKVIVPGVPVLQVTPMAAMLNKNPLGSLILSDECVIRLSFEQIEKRPGQLFVDGLHHELSGIRKIEIKRSAKTVSLGFRKNEDFISKMAAWQLG